MDRQEILYQLENPTQFELYLKSAATNRIAPDFYFKERRICGIEYSPEEIIIPSLDYSWSAERLIYNVLHSASEHYFRNDYLPDDVLIGDSKSCAIFKIPRHLSSLNYISEFINLIYVLKGTFKVSIDNDSITLNEGNAIIVAPYTEYSMEYSGINDIVLGINFKMLTLAKGFFNVLTFDNPISSFFDNLIFMSNCVKYMIIKSPPDERLNNLMLDALAEQEKNHFSRDKIIMNMIETFLLILASDYKNQTTQNIGRSETDNKALSILNYLHENYVNVSIDDLSRHFFLSPSYISRILKRRFGRSYVELLTEIRMSRAKELLAAENLTIEHISGLVGYADPRQFRYIFKKTFGISPSEYRSDLSR